MSASPTALGRTTQALLDFRGRLNNVVTARERSGRFLDDVCRTRELRSSPCVGDRNYAGFFDYPRQSPLGKGHCEQALRAQPEPAAGRVPPILASPVGEVRENPTIKDTECGFFREREPHDRPGQCRGWRVRVC